MTIGALAGRAGVSVETIRYYHRRGLLPLSQRTYGRVRRYGEDGLRRLLFIKRAQRLGFTLDEIAALLALNDGTGCGQARAVAEHKLEEIEARLRDLSAIRGTLLGLIRRCKSASGRIACPLIRTLSQPLPPA
jgi:MerR family mercuric resistance operon transcriptional regulator